MDDAATTPVDPRVAVRSYAGLTQDGIFGNPASRSHAFGWAAEEAAEEVAFAIAGIRTQVERRRALSPLWGPPSVRPAPLPSPSQRA